MRFLLLLAALANQPELPPAQEVVKKVVERALKDRLTFQELDLTYTKTQTIYDTKGRTVPKLEETKTWLMWYEDGHSVQQLLVQNGKGVKDAEPASPGPDAYARLPERYDFTWADSPIQTVDGRSTYVIILTPKKELPKARSRVENALVRMGGTLYIDVEHEYIRKLTCSLTKSFRKGWFVFKANTATAEFSQRLYGELVVFDGMTVRVNYAILGVETHNTYIYEYENYGPRKEPKPPDQ